MAHDVFISYSSDDAKLAKKIFNALTKMGISVYLDEKKINWGDNITEEVMSGLAESVAVIVVLSPGSDKSEWVPFEVGHAMAFRKRILPYLFSPFTENTSLSKGVALRHICYRCKENIFRQLEIRK